MPWIVLTIINLICSVILGIVFGIDDIDISDINDIDGINMSPAAVYDLSVGVWLISHAIACYFFIVVFAFRFLDIFSK